MCIRDSRKWPAEMRFISPSFNQQGWTSSFDLNSIAHGTSPAFSLHAQHPSGTQYAEYLSALAKDARLEVKLSTDVVQVEKVGGGFEVDVRPAGSDEAVPTETLRAKYVVWAAGEFQYPRKDSDSFPGAAHCVHLSLIHI